LSGARLRIVAGHVEITQDDEMPGWISSKEAKQLFPPMDDDYAFGEMDEAGRAARSSSCR
jgi:hypothetical protein